jgi:hypothetical protein
MRIASLPPFAAQATMVVSGGATLLALAGVVTAAVLIFTASLAVLWPVLIGCACAAAVGAIIVIVVRCAGAKATQDTITKFAYTLNAMGDNVPIANALETLAANSGIQLSENDRNEICRFVYDVRIMDEDGANTLGDLRQKRSKFSCLIKQCNISNDALPFLVPILALFPDSEFSLKRNANGALFGFAAFHESMNPQFHQLGIYSIFNYSDPEYYKRSSLCGGPENTANKHAFVVHYDGNKRLVVDYPPQPGNQSQMAG